MKVSVDPDNSHFEVGWEWDVVFGVHVLGQSVQARCRAVSTQMTHVLILYTQVFLFHMFLKNRTLTLILLTCSHSLYPGVSLPHVSEK